MLIPVWRPEWVLVTLANELLEAGIGAVIVVDDGSGASFQHIFQRLWQSKVTVLRHSVNLGKGRALKTGFRYLSTERPEYLSTERSEFQGVVTVDADGQHTVRDVLQVARRLLKGLERPVLGVRSFSGRVPLRSRLGNAVTSRLFGFVTGVRLGDTQTGLRGLPLALLPELVEVEGERYEYEVAMLAHLCRGGVMPMQVLIETVYLQGKRSSHFDPLLDSMRVYLVLARIFFSSLTPDSRVPMRLR